VDVAARAAERRKWKLISKSVDKQMDAKDGTGVRYRKPM
jgi:hypothetical protein